MQRKRFGFTLIELLIVVAIIGILAAIAVPNFLAARTRASVARVKADHRSYATAFESYYLDSNQYPDGLNSGCGYIQYLKGLTTPISYIADIRMIDPWRPEPSQFAVGCPDWIGTYLYVSLAGYWGRSVYPEAIKKGYVVMSYGPDRFQDNAEHFPHCYAYPQYCKVPSKKPLDMLYNSSNGIISGGDIARVGGEISAPVVIGG